MQHNSEFAHLPAADSRILCLPSCPNVAECSQFPGFQKKKKAISDWLLAELGKILSISHLYKLEAAVYKLSFKRCRVSTCRKRSSQHFQALNLTATPIFWGKLFNEEDHPSLGRQVKIVDSQVELLAKKKRE